MLNKLREINKKLILESEKNNNSKENVIQTVIQELLKNDRCFFDITMEESYRILKSLGFSIDESEEIYLKLLQGAR